MRRLTGLRSEGSYEVAVVGAGIMGVAASWRLATSGKRVALLEQYGLDHTTGSSHGRSRIFRLAYDVADYVRLAREALSGWRELESDSGRQVLITTGGFDVGPPERLGAIASALTDAGEGFQWLSRQELRARNPALDPPESWEAIFQPNAGVIRASQALDALLALVRSQGGSIRPHRRVLAIKPEADHVLIETDQGSMSVEVVVVTAGGWAGELLERLDLSVPIRVTREHVAYFKPSSGRLVHPFIWHPANGSPQGYGLPSLLGGTTKVGLHGAGAIVKPGGRGTPEAQRIEALASFVGQCIPGLIAKPLLPETCLYASTPDDDFVIERHGRVIVAAGFGGHGFKFAPRIGSLVSEMLEGRVIPYAERFTRRRFQTAVHAP